MDETFIFEIPIVSSPHTAETTQENLGTTFYNPDFPREVFARETLSDLFQDAICHCIELKMRMLIELPESKSAIAHLDQRLKLYESLREQVKFVRSEKI